MTDKKLLETGIGVGLTIFILFMVFSMWFEMYHNAHFLFINQSFIITTLKIGGAISFMIVFASLIRGK